MNSFRHSVLVIVSAIGYLLSSVNSNEFCQSFTQNGFKIDYGLSIRVFDLDMRHVIAIDYDIWLLNTDHQTVSFVSRLSLKSHAFGNRYSAGFSIMNDRDVYETGFLQTSSDVIVWTRFKSNPIEPKIDDLLNVKNPLYEPTDIAFGPQFKPSIAFEIIVDNIFRICFIEKQMIVKNNKTLHSYRYRLFDFESISGNKRKAIELNASEEVKQTLDQISNDYELIAVFKPLKDLGHLFLYRVDEQIVYCFSIETNDTTDRCNGERIQVLIDCAIDEWTLPETTVDSQGPVVPPVRPTVTEKGTTPVAVKDPKRDGSKGYSFLIIIFIVLFFLFIVVCFCIALFVMLRKKKTETTDETENVDNKDGDKDKSAQTEEPTKVLFKRSENSDTESGKVKHPKVIAPTTGTHTSNVNKEVKTKIAAKPKPVFKKLSPKRVQGNSRLATNPALTSRDSGIDI